MHGLGSWHVHRSGGGDRRRATSDNTTRTASRSIRNSGSSPLTDGMGGHRAGEIASAMAAQIILAGLRQRLPHWVRRRPALPTAGRRGEHKPSQSGNLGLLARTHARYRHGNDPRSGAIPRQPVVIGHIGDSRVYRLREGQLQLLTRDDSLLRDQVDVGIISVADAGESHNRSLVTQALGVAEQVAAHVREVRRDAGRHVRPVLRRPQRPGRDADIELILQSRRQPASRRAAARADRQGQRGLRQHHRDRRACAQALPRGRADGGAPLVALKFGARRWRSWS